MLTCLNALAPEKNRTVILFLISPSLPEKYVLILNSSVKISQRIHFWLEYQLWSRLPCFVWSVTGNLCLAEAHRCKDAESITWLQLHQIRTPLNQTCTHMHIKMYLSAYKHKIIQGRTNRGFKAFSIVHIKCLKRHTARPKTADKMFIIETSVSISSKEPGDVLQPPTVLQATF